MDSHIFHTTLTSQQYVPVPIDISFGTFAAAASAFLAFLDAVPDDTKRTLHFKSPHARGSADGYSDKRNIEGKDPKEFFHWTPRIQIEASYQEVIGASPEARAFFTQAEQIYTTAEKIVLDIFSSYFPTYLEHLGSSPRTHITNAVVRFLAYTPIKESMRAKGHYDKSLGTLALAESSPGLRIGLDDTALTPVVHKDGTALFMPGLLLSELSDGNIPAAWHDVVQRADIPDINHRCARWAIVFFFDHKNGIYPSWETVHKPLSKQVTV